MPEVREPIKQTSIEKKQKIIDAGLKLLAKKDIIILIQQK